MVSSNTYDRLGSFAKMSSTLSRRLAANLSFDAEEPLLPMLPVPPFLSHQNPRENSNDLQLLAGRNSFDGPSIPALVHHPSLPCRQQSFAFFTTSAFASAKEALSLVSSQFLFALRIRGRL